AAILCLNARHNRQSWRLCMFFWPATTPVMSPAKSTAPRVAESRCNKGKKIYGHGCKPPLGCATRLWRRTHGPCFSPQMRAFSFGAYVFERGNMLIQDHQVDLDTPTGTMRCYVYR